MSKMGKLIVALAMALMLSLALFTSGTFAQSVKTDKATQVAVATHAVHAVTQTSYRWGGGFNGGFGFGGFDGFGFGGFDGFGCGFGCGCGCGCW